MNPSDLADPFWRLRNLYCCKEQGTGKTVPFRMRPEQEMILRQLHDEPTVPVFVVKSRRLGLSTGIGIGMTDFCAWNGGSTGRLIERTKDFAGEKMRDILRFSFNSMPKELIARFEVKHKDSPQMLDPKVAGNDEGLRSMIIAGVEARGGDCSFLHVSEWGPIAHKDPRRSEEILTGALPAASMGRKVVETTWMGGRRGHLWNLVRPLIEREPGAVGKLFFFPWWLDPVCVNMDGIGISNETENYFGGLEDRLGKKFEREQKRWYHLAHGTQGIFMRREYPSTLDEALSAPVEGAIYATEIGIAEAEGRITKLPVDGNSLVHIFADLGSPRNTRRFYVQQSGRLLRVLRVDMGSDETLAQWWSRAQKYNYNLGTLFLPHDADHKQKGGITFADECRELGIKTEVVPPCDWPWTGINHLKGLFASLEFDSEKCRDALDALGGYHVDDEGEIVHDDSSHTADALRTLSEAHLHKRFKFNYADVSGAPEHSAVRRQKAGRIKPIRVCA